MLFDRPSSGERVVLVHAQLSGIGSGIESLKEFTTLAHSAGAHVFHEISINLKVRNPKYFIGLGIVSEIKAIVHAHCLNLMLINHTLSPAQTRNLEQELGVRVLDRTGLILDIFAQRARSYAGKLQVELAQLNYMATRLVRGWTHLERQKGGIGLRGPGEKQLETDRRLIRDRIKYIRKRLMKIKQQRQQTHQLRAKQGLPVVALVGYTNAGKSTLFNQLADSDVYVQDQLFATLDPTVRQISITGLGPCLLIDTVGFIQALPHALIEAFAATLEETVQADLLLHVIDQSDAEQLSKKDEVYKVLKQIGVRNTPMIEVYNKIDLSKKSPFFVDTQPVRVGVSSRERIGFTELYSAIKRSLQKDLVEARLIVSPELAEFRAKLFDLQAIMQEELNEAGHWVMTVAIKKWKLEHVAQQLNIDWLQLQE